MASPINISSKQFQLPRTSLNKQEPNRVTPTEPENSKNLWLFSEYCDELTPIQIKTFNDTTNIKYNNPQP